MNLQLSDDEKSDRAVFVDAIDEPSPLPVIQAY
jgi:hypothetical protein